MDLLTKNIIYQDSSEEVPNKNYGGSSRGNLKIRNNRMLLCPVLTCQNKYKVLAALETHLKVDHKIKDGYIPPRENQQKLIDNYANCGEFSLVNQSIQEMKLINLSPEVNYNNLPQNRTQNIKLEQSSSDLLNRASVVQRRAPSSVLKISSLNRLENLSDAMQNASLKSSETQSLQEMKTINLCPGVNYNNLPQNTTQNFKLESSEVLDIYASSEIDILENLNKRLREAVDDFHSKRNSVLDKANC